MERKLSRHPFVTKYWFKSFILGTFTALIGFLPHIVTNGGFVVFANDYSALMLPENFLMHEALFSGNLLWNWSIDLGGNFLESYGSGLFNPFTLIVVLLPKSLIPYAMTYLTILAFGWVSMAGSLYLKRHLKDEGVIVLCSVLYAFCGWNIVNLTFYGFLFRAALFPLMLIALEKLVEEKAYGYLLVASFLNILCCSITFFWAEVIFLVLYYLFRYVRLADFKEWSRMKRNLETVGRCILEGGLGLACVAVLLLPTIRNLLGNDRSLDIVSPFSFFSIKEESIRALKFVKGIILPAEPMAVQSCISPQDWSSNSLYLPVVGIVFSTAYLLDRRDWLSRLILACFVVAAVPVLNSAFMAFNATPYRRWYYMFALVLVLAAGKTIETDSATSIRKAAIISFALMAGFFVATFGFSFFSAGKVILDGKWYGYGMAIAFLGTVFCGLYPAIPRSGRKSVLTVCICMTSILLLGVQILRCRNADVDDFTQYRLSYSENVLSYLTETTEDLSAHTLPYRYYFDEGGEHTGYNFSFVKTLPSVNSFFSTPHGSVFEFYKCIGKPRMVSTRACDDNGKNLLSVRHIVSVSDSEKYTFTGSKSLSSGKVMYYYENEDALPIGFTYDGYMTRSEFEAIDPLSRQFVMLLGLVIKDEDEVLVSGQLRHISDSEMQEALSKEDDIAILNARRDGSSQSFGVGKNTFRSVIESSADAYAFYSVPYDTCWHAEVNDSPVQILNINGLMAVPVQAGRNDIIFRYRYPLLGYGILLSVMAAVVSAVYLMLSRRKRKHDATPCLSYE